MPNEHEDIKAVVFKQFRLKWQEVGKSAVVAGISASLTILGTSIYAQKLPTTEEFKLAGMVGLTTMLGAVIRYFTNPTTTVIKGQVDPVSKVVSQDTVITKDTDEAKAN